MALFQDFLLRFQHLGNKPGILADIPDFWKYWFDNIGSLSVYKIFDCKSWNRDDKPGICSQYSKSFTLRSDKFWLSAIVWLIFQEFWKKILEFQHYLEFWSVFVILTNIDLKKFDYRQYSKIFTWSDYWQYSRNLYLRFQNFWMKILESQH